MKPIRPCFHRENASLVFPRIPLAKRGQWERCWYGDVALGNLTQYRFFLSWLVELSEDRLFVGIEGRGCYTFLGFVDAGYVASKLNLCEADAGNVADFINSQLQGDGAVQGRYQDDLCEHR